MRALQEGLIGVNVDPATGVTWETWDSAIRTAAEVESASGESDWSFENVSQ